MKKEIASAPPANVPAPIGPAATLTLLRFDVRDYFDISAPGTYSLHVEAPGFRGYDQEGIRLDLNQAATQDIRLIVGEVQQTVTVNSDVSGINTVTSELSDEVTEAQLRDLPLSSRNPYSLL